MRNFHSREISQRIKTKSELTPWEGHMTLLEIPAESDIAGKSLLELQLREKLGINIAIIKRGEMTINMPARTEKVYPKDTLYVIGTDEQVAAFQEYLHASKTAINGSETEIILKKIQLENSDFIGKSIREAGLREKTNGLVVGIERNNERIMNPESDVILVKNDILWIVGDKRLINEML